MDARIFVEDENGGDSFELRLEEMVDEKLAGINLKILALDVLYLEYQLQTPAQRASFCIHISHTHILRIFILKIYSR